MLTTPLFPCARPIQYIDSAGEEELKDEDKSISLKDQQVATLRAFVNGEAFRAVLPTGLI